MSPYEFYAEYSMAPGNQFSNLDIFSGQYVCEIQLTT